MHMSHSSRPPSPPLAAQRQAHKRTRMSSEAADISSSPSGGSAKRARSKVDLSAGESGSGYTGVCHHVRTNRFEAHIWLEGKQHYLGGYSTSSQAALAYDICAVRLRGEAAHTNFHLQFYKASLPGMMRYSPAEVIAALRRASKGMAPQQQSSMWRGVSRHKKGRWEARIGSVAGRRYHYVGLYSTELEAAIAYDKAALELRGVEAPTNLHLSEYWGLLSEEQKAEAAARGLVTQADLQLKGQMEWLAGQVQGSGDEAATAEGAAAIHADALAEGLAAAANGDFGGPPCSPALQSPADAELPLWPAASTSDGASPVSAADDCQDELARSLLDCLLQDSTVDVAGSPQSVLQPVAAVPLPHSALCCPA